MNKNYIYEYSNLLERVLSVGYKYRYSTKMIEKAISDSSFFRSLERNSNKTLIDKELISEIYQNPNIDVESTPIYNQCLWAAEAYIRIQEQFKFTFEAIFLYIPIEKMYSYFLIFHEMDFSQILQEFNNLYLKQSVLDKLIENYKYSLKSISDITDIPYNSLYSYKQRRRDIKNIKAEDAIKLSNLLRVRPETLLEMKL